MEKYKNDKGFSILLVIGSYGGFNLIKQSRAIRICIGFIALTLFFYDVENALRQNLLKPKNVD